MTIEVERVNPTGWRTGLGLPPPGQDDVVALARAWMLIYLCLDALSPAARFIRPLGSGVAEQERRDGTVVLLEDDRSTTQERAEARPGGGEYRGHPDFSRFDMLTGAVPGTDLIVGSSRRLYAACAELPAAQRRIAVEVDQARPRRPSDLEQSDEALVAVREYRAQQYREHELEDDQLYENTRRGFETGYNLR
jgi:hypothetical protein